MKRLKALAISLFGEDLWPEWCEVAFALAISVYFGWSQSTQMVIVAYIFGKAAFRRLRTLQRSLTDLAAKLEELKA